MELPCVPDGTECLTDAPVDSHSFRAAWEKLVPSSSAWIHPADEASFLWETTLGQEGELLGQGSFGKVAALSGIYATAVCKSSVFVRDDVSFVHNHFPGVCVLNPGGEWLASGLCQGFIQEIATGVGTQTLSSVVPLLSYHCRLVDRTDGETVQSVDSHLVYPRLACDAYAWSRHRRRAAWAVRRPDVERVVVQIVHGLVELHRLGIVHQDIRPANLLLTTDASAPADDTRCFLHDFGKAEAFSNPVHQYRVSGWSKSPAIRLGAGVYETPEHASNAHSRSGIPTDMWGLGMTMVEMLLYGVTDAPPSSRMKRYQASPEGRRLPHPFTTLFSYSAPRDQARVLGMFLAADKRSKARGFPWLKMLPPSLGSDGRELIASLLHRTHTKRPVSMESVWNSPYIARLRSQHGYFPLADTSPLDVEACLDSLNHQPDPLAVSRHHADALVAALRVSSRLSLSLSWPVAATDAVDPHTVVLSPAVSTPAEIMLRLCALGAKTGLHLDRVFRAFRLFLTGAGYSNPTRDGSLPSLRDSESVALLLAALTVSDKVTGVSKFASPASLVDGLLALAWGDVAIPSLREVVEAECLLVNCAGACLLAPTLISMVDLSHCPREWLGGVAAGLIGWYLVNPHVDPLLSSLTPTDVVQFRHHSLEWLPRYGVDMRIMEWWTYSVLLVTPCCKPRAENKC